MATEHDYYGYLGVNRAASPDEIQKAFRKLALKYHPDSTGNDPKAAAKLKLVQEAYDVLGNAATRKEYDRVWFAEIDSAFGGDAAPEKARQPAWQSIAVAGEPAQPEARAPRRPLLGIELTTGQKIQVAVILLVLGVAGFFVFSNTRTHFDSSVNSYVKPIVYFDSQGRRVSAKDPKAVPEKEETHTFFACNDGQVEIIEYKKDPSRHPQIVWHPDRRDTSKVFIYYLDPMAPVAKIKEPFRHALAYATYKQVFETPMGLLGSTSMNPDQTAREKAAREQMNAEMALIKAGIESGAYQRKLMDEVMKALAEYQAKPGDPMKDAAKAALARRVLEAIAAFDAKRLDDQYKHINKYMDVIEGMLEDGQKASLVAALDARLNPTARGPARRGPAASAPAARGNTNAATRGGTRGAGGRGAATARGTTAPAGG
jgi:curved DNA-binding protein CbpA